MRRRRPKSWLALAGTLAAFVVLAGVVVWVAALLAQ